MRIVHYIYDLGVGGIENMLVNIVNEQIKDCPEIYILVLNDLIDESIVSAIDRRVKVIYVGKPHGSKNILYILKANYLLRKIKPDVIHCHYAKLYRTIFFEDLKKRACVTQHRNCNGSGAYLLKKFKKIFSISYCVKEDIKKTFGLESTVVYNGIIPSKLKKRVFDGNRRIDFRIVQLGRLYHQDKGQHLLVEAVSELIQRGFANITVDFIGDGPSRDFLMGLVEKYALQNVVRFLGAKSQSYLYDHLCDYDLQVQPSLYEGFGLSVAEAMAAKVPVLVADNLGPMEVIDFGSCGKYFKYANVKSLADEIASIILNGYDQDVLDRAYERVLDLFNVRNTAVRYVSEYENFLRDLSDEKK